MDCVVEPDVVAFAERVVPFLSRAPVEHSVILTLLAARTGGAVVDQTPPVCAYATDAGEVVGVALRTPPWKATLSVMPVGAAIALEQVLWEADPGAPAVSGPVESARLFAERRSARIGRPARVGMAQRMYALTDLVPPEVPGAARPVEPGDVSLVARWWQDFAAEAVPGEPAGVTESAVRRRMAVGVLRLWWDGGRPVSMASYVGPVAGVARVAPVYTPPEYRRHGYGAAITAACSANALAHGAAKVMLYTDLANPTSNSIYQRIGYRPVLDASDFHFD